MSVPAAISDLEFEIADLKRRMSNLVRPATVKAVGADGTTVKADIGHPDFVSHDIPVFTHAGAGADYRPPKPGQQITLLCPDGDLANALCLPGGYHDANPPPSTDPTQDVLAQRGSARLRVTDGNLAFIEAGSSSIRVEDGKITLTATAIVTAGATHLGGPGGVPVAKQGSVDSHGDVEVANLATQVFVT